MEAGEADGAPDGAAPTPAAGLVGVGRTGLAGVTGGADADGRAGGALADGRGGCLAHRGALHTLNGLLSGGREMTDRNRFPNILSNGQHKMGEWHIFCVLVWFTDKKDFDM